MAGIMSKIAKLGKKMARCIEYSQKYSRLANTVTENGGRLVSHTGKGGFNVREGRGAPDSERNPSDFQEPGCSLG